MVEITSTENPPVWWPGWDKFILRRFLSGTETETETKSLLRLCFCLCTKISVPLRFCFCFCFCIRIFFVFVQIFRIRPFPDGDAINQKVSLAEKYIKISIIQALKLYSVVNVCDLYLLSKLILQICFRHCIV